MDFLRSPHLPERAISLALIGDAPDAVPDCLSSRGIELLQLPHNEKLSGAVSTHADVNVFHAGNGVLFCDNLMQDTLQALQPKKLISCDISGGYPTDCALNAAWVGGHVFAHPTATDERLRAFLTRNGVTFHGVKQGYANCSVCAVNDHALMTDDSGIYLAAKDCGIDALLLQKGDILLPGHDYGFIGGASALIAPNELVFFGDLRTHRDCAAIQTFLQQHGVNYTDIPSIPLTDIGGIVAIK